MMRKFELLRGTSERALSKSSRTKILALPKVEGIKGNQ